MKQVIIHTDGGCHGNPGPGGWGAILEYCGRKSELSGGVPATTNNRMELQAAIAAIGALKESCQVDIHTDSEYVKNGITKWLAGWKRSGWRTKTKEPVKNEDLWRALDALVAQHRIEWHGSRAMPVTRATNAAINSPRPKLRRSRRNTITPR